MQLSGVTRTTLATALAAAALVATAPARAGQTGGALTGAPTVGTCSTMTTKQAGEKTDTSTVVPCKQKHTAYVAGVVKVPASVDISTASPKRLFRVVATKCTPKVLEALGPATWARVDDTAYYFVYFEPTSDELAAGARWLSCSIVLYHGARIAPLPKRKPPFITRGRHDDSIARCLTKSVMTTPCSASHAWRATGTFTLKAATRPPVKSLNRTGARKCLPFVNRHRTYRFTYKDALTWSAAGDHTVVCYSKTTS